MTGAAAKTRVLFVCLGNICRSPMAEGVFRDLVERAGLVGEFEIDSAGTGNWHIGDPPDQRAVRAAAARGIDISGQRARQVRASDFEAFDHLIAMDGANFDTLARMAPGNRTGRISLALAHVPGKGRCDVPDPYYGGPEGFERALDLLDEAARGLLNQIARN